MPAREHLPQLDGGLFLTDGGIETTLIFLRGIDLPEFAAFPLLLEDEGLDALRAYYAPYLRLAEEHGAGFVLESPTWRASPRWGQTLGYDADQLDAVNRRAIALMEELRADTGAAAGPVVIRGASARTTTATARPSSSRPMPRRRTTPRRSEPSRTPPRTWSRRSR